MKDLRYALVFCALLLSARGAFAQQQDSAARRDTTRTPPVFAQDSVHPIPQLADVPLGPARGFSDGIWTWDRDTFHDEWAITLGQLLERIPGIMVLRTGMYVQPEAASVFGATANRVEVWIDGYAIDPIMESSVDLSRIELANVQSVRVERRLNRIRVHIQTLMPQDNRAYSRIEAGVGQPNANVFRGLFAAPHLLVGPLAVALDRIDTNGTQGLEPANQTNAWAKYSFIRGASGIQIEYRRNITTRNPQVPWVEKYDRADVIARGRMQLRPGVVAELFGGRTTVSRDTASVITKRDSFPKLNDQDTQFGGRLGFDSKIFWASAAARVHGDRALPSSQIDVSGGVRYNIVSATAELTQSNWRDAGSAAELTLRAEAGPFRGLRVFGETTSSDRGASYFAGVSDDSIYTITKYSGMRAGAQLEWRGITAGVAGLKIKNDSVIPFGLPFDRRAISFFGGDATGVEANGRIPLPLIKGLAAIGHVTNWQSGTIPLYLPTRMYRAGLELHTSPLKSDNLEILGRFEAVHRGAMLVLNPDTKNDALLTQPAWNSIDAYLQIRIMDIRAFIRVEDFQGQVIEVLPNRTLRGARMIYGLKWQFYN